MIINIMTIILFYMSTCVSLIQLQWRKHYTEVAVAEDTNIQYFTITFWNHLKYLNYLYAALFPILLFVCVCCAVLWCFCCLLSSLWLIQGLHSFSEAQQKKPTHNHLLISAQIPAPPAVWMVLTFDIFLCS